MVKCCVPNCKTKFRYVDKNCRLFSLPKEETRRREWIKFTQLDPSRFNPNTRYRFCELHFDENQFELNRQDKWKKLKWTAVPSIYPVVESNPVEEKPRKSKKQKSLSLQHLLNNIIDIPIPKTKTGRSPRTTRASTAKAQNLSQASTSKAENIHSDLPNEDDDEIIEVEIVTIPDDREDRLSEATAENDSVSKIQELQNENEKLRKENEHLRITVEKMKRILARRRFTYLNVKALINDKDKAIVFENLEKS